MFGIGCFPCVVSIPFQFLIIDFITVNYVGCLWFFCVRWNHCNDRDRLLGFLLGCPTVTLISFDRMNLTICQINFFFADLLVHTAKRVCVCVCSCVRVWVSDGVYSMWVDFPLRRAACAAPSGLMVIPDKLLLQRVSEWRLWQWN